MMSKKSFIATSSVTATKSPFLELGFRMEEAFYMMHRTSEIIRKKNAKLASTKSDRLYG